MSEVDRSKWIVNLGGKDYPTWPYVLDEAHKRGLKRLECELVQIPAAENGNVAIVKATAEFAKPSDDSPYVNCLYTAYGDASPGNVNHKMAGAIIRMAETRAKGRCLRDACNIGMTLAEELPDDDQPGSTSPSNGQAVARAPQQPARAAANADGTVACEEPGCGVLLTKAQVTLSQHKTGAHYCPAHSGAHAKA